MRNAGKEKAAALPSSTRHTMVPNFPKWDAKPRTRSTSTSRLFIVHGVEVRAPRLWHTRETPAGRLSSNIEHERKTGGGSLPPLECHGCCNHPYLPSQYPYGSPYPHHFPVNYPSFPVHYMPTPPPPPQHPPFYPMEQPRYEYDKNAGMGGNHCCGCPNHMSHKKEQPGSVRIEEEESEGERRRNESPIPLQLRNGSYPIVWVPSDYNSKNKQVKEDKGNDDKYDNRVVWKDGGEDGWYPLDLSNLVSSKKRVGNEGRKKGQGDEDEGKGHFPFPLFWIPYNPGETEKEMGKNEVDSSKAKPSMDSEKRFHLMGDDSGGRDAPRVKDIKVKEAEKHKENESLENQVKERVKEGIYHGEKKVEHGESLSKDNLKMKSVSPPKSPKLPPVCLRVDPLPRRKAANGNSRSPSPPGDRQKPDLRPDEEKSKVLKTSDNVKVDKKPTKDFTEGKNTKSVEVFNGGELKNVDVNKGNPVSIPVKSEDGFSSKRSEETPKEDDMSRAPTETDAVKGQSEKAEPGSGMKEVEDAKVTSTRKLSEEEAAVLIQSAYRGFDVRRWEPVKKLKQIAKVQEQINHVKNMIQEMEASPDVHGSGKQRNIISETIMSLLLRVDTIQGLHPSVREVRKSVVKELVNLQEKLDSLVNKKTEHPPQEESNLKSTEDASNKTEVDVNFSNDGNKSTSDVPVAAQNQPDGEELNSENLQVPVMNLDRAESEETLMKGDEKIIKAENKFSNQRSENEDNHEVLFQEDVSEIPVTEEASEKITDFVQSEADKLATELDELPLGIVDDLCVKESSNQKLDVTDMKTACEEEQPEEQKDIDKALELHNDVTDKEIHEVNDEVLPASEINTSLEMEDNKIEDEKSEPEVIAAVAEQPVAPEETMMVEATNKATDTHENLEAFKGNENVDEKEDNVDEMGAVEVTDKATDTHENLEAFKGNENADEEKDAAPDEMCIVPDNGKNLEASGNEYANEKKDVVWDETPVMLDKVEDDSMESKRKLIEENERLRGIMEKLIQSGQQQLAAISTLTGRVKDLERKLSKKRKVKVSHLKNNKTRSLVALED
ncbi:BAG family molecular chaperone regulator 6 [Striga hermonthica]|uniref:BAG family molecular chaperone regulator 6 n=1 Tax=Striga hermonthica TaxID=68872 RepID=A0A9N7NK84_STRHE|nr:BAG family molecular chaperone regulator 6 [Striga hermonthica]